MPTTIAACFRRLMERSYEEAGGVSMIETLVAGGPVMVPIGLCSVIAVVVFLERIVVAPTLEPSCRGRSVSS